MTPEQARVLVDRDGDLWVETRPDHFCVAHSQSHADRLKASGKLGTTRETVHVLYGPLRGQDDDQ